MGEKSRFLPWKINMEPKKPMCFEKEENPLPNLPVLLHQGRDDLRLQTLTNIPELMRPPWIFWMRTSPQLIFIITNHCSYWLPWATRTWLRIWQVQLPCKICWRTCTTISSTNTLQKNAPKHDPMDTMGLISLTFLTYCWPLRFFGILPKKHKNNHRENGGTIGVVLVPLIINPTYYIHLI